MKRVKEIKISPLAGYTNQLFKNLTELELARADSLKFCVVKGASKVHMNKFQRGFLMELVALAKDIDNYFACPLNDNRVPADLIQRAGELSDQITDASSELYDDDQEIDVRDVIDFGWYKSEYLDCIIMLLAFCEMHKCSTMIVALQLPIIKLIYVVQTVIEKFNLCHESSSHGTFKPINLFSQEWFEDLLERFGAKLDAELSVDPISFEHREEQTVFNLEEQAEIRQREIENQKAEKAAKELRDRQELSATYGKEILECVDGVNLVDIPAESREILLTAKTIEQCDMIDALSMFLRAYASHVYPDKEYSGDRVMMFTDAIEHICRDVVLKNTPSYMTMINMVTPKVVIRSLKLLGNGLRACISSTLDELVDENAKYSYDFRLGTNIKIYKEN